MGLIDVHRVLANQQQKKKSLYSSIVLYHKNFYRASFGIHTCSNVKSGRLPEHLVRPQGTHYPVVDHQPLPPQYLNYRADRVATVLPKKWN